MEMRMLVAFLIGTMWNVTGIAQPCLPGGITITSQSQIDQFPQSFQGCTEIIGDVYIQGMDVTNLDSFYQVVSISGDMIISGNPQLISLDGLSALTVVGKAMRIQNNPLLLTLSGLQHLSAVEGDFFYIGNNSMLQSLSGLSALDSVVGIFHIWGLDSLRSLSGLDELRWVGNNLAIFQNDQLENLAGLESIQHIGADLRLEDNPLLADIQALAHPVTINGALVISGNTDLDDCDVTAVCDYLSNPVSFVVISGNASGCLSVEEVQEDCLASVSGTNGGGGPMLFPNPATTYISWIPMPIPITQVRMYNAMGVLCGVETGHPTHMEVAHLPQGLYWLEFISGARKNSVPFVIRN